MRPLFEIWGDASSLPVPRKYRILRRRVSTSYFRSCRIALYNMKPISALPTGATLLEYVKGLAATGLRVLPGSDGTYWVAYGDRHVRRLPAFHVGTPSQSEVDRVLRTTGALIATYLAEPDP